jgi:hypothetical protein
VRSKKDELRVRPLKRKSESGCNGCKATARLSNREHRQERQASQFFPLSTVGYGDITPLSQAARWLATLEAMTGLLYVAVVVAGWFHFIRGRNPIFPEHAVSSVGRRRDRVNFSTTQT